MARFGQGFIQSLTRPSYSQGLFDLGQQIGSAPTRRMEQQEQSKAMTMVNEALASQDPQKLLAAAQAIQQIDPQTAAKLSQAAGQLNQQAQQASLLRSNAVSAAESAQLPTDVIEGFRDSPEDLMSLAKDVQSKRSLSNLDRLEENRQIRMQTQRAQQANVPPEILEDVASGLYVNQNSKFLDAIQGKDASQSNYVDSKGNFVTLPSRGSRVLVNNNWVTPDQAGLVAAPTTTAETTLTEFSSNNKLIGQSALSSGIINSFIDSLDTSGSLSGLLLQAKGEKAIGIYSDATKDLRAFQGNIPEVLSRIASGAAIKNDELPRYENLFTVNASDFLSPVASAQKIIRTAALVSLDAKRMSGEITPAKLRELLEKAGSITLSPEEVKQINSNKPGSLKAVVQKYTNSYFGDVKPEVSEADQILKDLGL